MITINFVNGLPKTTVSEDFKNADWHSQECMLREALIELQTWYSREMNIYLENKRAEG